MEDTTSKQMTRDELTSAVLSLRKQLKIVPIESLVITDNPKDHTEADIEEVRRSFRLYGWTGPIICQAGTRVVLAGHKRYYAAIKDGLTKVPIIEKELSDLRADAYKIADNELSERGGLNQAVMAMILERLAESEEEGFDLTFLSGAKLAGIREEEEPPETFDAPDSETEYACPKCGYEWSGSPK